ncbi:MAG: hypothetical protein ABSB15_18090 [Bryobacteraceae bacterium]
MSNRSSMAILMSRRVLKFGVLQFLPRVLASRQMLLLSVPLANAMGMCRALV